MEGRYLPDSDGRSVVMELSEPGERLSDARAGFSVLGVDIGTISVLLTLTEFESELLLPAVPAFIRLPA